MSSINHPVRTGIKLLIACCVLSVISPSFANAQKKVLDHSVYDSWKSLVNLALTDDGKYALGIIKEQDGNDQLLIREIASKRELVIPRGYTFAVTPDQKQVITLIKASYDEIRQAKIKKTEAEKMPKDSLAIIRLSDFSVTKIANAVDFKTGKDFSEYIAYTLGDTLKAKDETGKTLVVQHLYNNKKDTIPYVKEYQFSRNGKTLAIATLPAEKDSTAHTQVIYIDLNLYDKKVVSAGQAQYKQLTISESGKKVAFLATADPKKTEIKEYNLYYFTASADSAILLAGKSTEGMPASWIVSENRAPEFSKDEARLFLGTAPEQMPKDTTIPDFEKAALDIWNWQDSQLQPQQLVDLKREQSRSYLAFFDLNQAQRIYQLATKDIPNVQVSDENNGQYAMGSSNLAYRRNSAWDGLAGSTYDLWLFDLTAHTQKQVKTALTAECHLSPKGDYIAWYNQKDSAYYAWSVKTGAEVCLTRQLPVNFWNEKHDTPSLPHSYGVASWTENDESLLINDAYDIWQFDPTGTKSPQNITKGVGRERKIRLRYFRTDPESRFITSKEKLMFTAFDETTKEYGFFELSKSAPKQLIIDKFNYTVPIKAKNKEIYLYTKSNFHTSPDLYATANSWKTESRLSDINPQQNDYNWGTAELVSWTTYDGKPTQGIVYKPEDFDPAKKYPLMVYFYEKLSDNLYSYIAPVPSRSIINIPFFCSQGYIVFTPDIQYTIGHPGESAYNSIVSGVEKLCENAWIDKANMALQGQSWGGYQTAYLITRTNLFKAAGAGAPVSNMFSAYGGIRWGTGISRAFQYEQTQSRIGKTIWEAPELYRENSPLFFADKVETPLLITHNDKDGAVPWYQGIEYFIALRRLGKPVWLLQYNGEEHNLTERKNSKDLSIRLQQFFDHYLKGAPAPVWMSKGVPATEKGKTYGFEYE
ncbi:MAG: prolyl oligopeptidase family serine peptidase [Tannerella sp.]|nr:prolyl oligopeptidase family serine peptidase [Tannerella sp.]